MYVTIFIDMLARCVNPHVFPLGTLVSPLGIELTITLPYRLQIAYTSMPQEVYLDFRSLPLPPSLSVQNLHLLHFFPDDVIIFAHILVSPASTIIPHL